jgi:uncharacterized protein
MNLFFDTSALVKFFHNEDGTDKVTDLIENSDNEVWILDIAKLEFRSAVFRRFRNGEIEKEELDTALRFFSEQLTSFNVESIGPGVLKEAENLLDDYGMDFGLRTLDALHLGAFQLISEKDWVFITSDKNLTEAAKASGAKVLDPASN